jgi:hypothetical protein
MTEFVCSNMFGVADYRIMRKDHPVSTRCVIGRFVTNGRSCLNTWQVVVVERYTDCLRRYLMVPLAIRVVAVRIAIFACR